MDGVTGMFNEIAHRYDLLNHLFSLNADTFWRNRLARAASLPAGAKVLDCCCGTADQAISLAVRFPRVSVVGVDRAERMLALGREKIRNKGLADRITLQSGDVEELPFEDGSFDLVSISFGLRNIADKGKALREVRRVLRPRATLLILEFSPSASPPIRRVFRFYRAVVMPALGGKLSGAPAAYRYLSSSIDGFLSDRQIAGLLRASGFEAVSHRRLSAGIACLHSARRGQNDPAR